MFLPEVIYSGVFSDFSITIVRAPGKYSFIKFSAVFDMDSTYGKRFSLLFDIKINGLDLSLPFISYILSTPFFESGKQPNPHTVSVTKAITPPSFNKILSSSMNELLSNIVSNSFN